MGSRYTYSAVFLAINRSTCHWQLKRDWI